MRFVLFFAFLFTTACYSQSPLWLSVNADASGKNFSSIPISPTVIYFPSSHWGIGVSGFGRKVAGSTTSDFSGLVRYYPCRKGFVQASLGNNLNTNELVYGAMFGYTAPIGKVFYVEPGLKYTRSDGEDYLGVSIGLGLKL